MAGQWAVTKLRGRLEQKQARPLLIPSEARSTKSMGGLKDKLEICPPPIQPRVYLRFAFCDLCIQSSLLWAVETEGRREN